MLGLPTPILGHLDASQEPKWFTTSPTKAINKALEKSNLKLDQL